jgi:hypothetical protein
MKFKVFCLVSLMIGFMHNAYSNINHATTHDAGIMVCSGPIGDGNDITGIPVATVTSTQCILGCVAGAQCVTLTAVAGVCSVTSTLYILMDTAQCSVTHTVSITVTNPDMTTTTVTATDEGSGRYRFEYAYKVGRSTYIITATENSTGNVSTCNGEYLVLDDLTINNLVPTPGVGQIELNFTMGNCAPITNYEYTLNGGVTWTPLSPAVTGTTVTVSNLTCGTSYTMQLRAVNAEGAGVSSTTVTATTIFSNDVTVTYTGQTIATTTNKSTSVTLSASVTLPAGANASQSQFRFINRNTGQPISGWLAITGSSNTGTVSHTAALTLGTYEIFKKYNIGFEVGNTGCYIRNNAADNVTVTVAEPSCGCY